MLRYRSEGEVHKDFHGLTCATLHYLVDNYGEDAVREVLSNTAQNVYKTIHEKLKKGDCGELVEFWEYYLTREGGNFSLERMVDGVRLVVKDCPALHHLTRLEQSPDEILCRATRIFNDALCEGSPFNAVLTRTGEFSCVQEVRR